MSSSVRPRHAPPREGERPPAAPVIGVDVGVCNLFAFAPAGDDDLEATVTVGGRYERALLDELEAVSRRLRLAPGDTAEAEARARRRYERALLARYDRAAACLESYARRADAAAVAIEDLPGTVTLEESLRHGRELDDWALRALQDRARRRLEPHLPVVEVDPQGTTRECHVCGERGELERRDRALRCETVDCHVRTVDQDESAAVSIANRAVDRVFGSQVAVHCPRRGGRV